MRAQSSEDRFELCPHHDLGRAVLDFFAQLLALDQRRGAAAQVDHINARHSPSHSSKVLGR